MDQMMLNLVPVFLIVILGYITQKLHLFSRDVIEGLKTIIVKLALPCVLFVAFAKSDMSIGNIAVIFLIFAFCLLLYGIGSLLHRFFPILFPDSYTNGYFTGFEFGMIGIGLFTALWGIEKLPAVAVIAFGHEIFIWFVYVPLLESRKFGSFNIKKTLINFFKSPVIIAILAGIMVNLLDLFPIIETSLAGKIILKYISMMGNVISPLILIVIGYSLTFKKIPIRKSVLLIVLRWAVVLAGGFGLAQVFKMLMPSTDPFFITAFYAFILLPPPFILPLFIEEKNQEEISYFSELLIYYTITSFIGYIILMSIS